MSLCPSSSHQLVAAAIAFRRARRKFPKDFGLKSAVERTSGSTKTQKTATSREGPINQARSSSTLVRRAYNSRSDHVCPTSVRNRDYDRSCSKENSISCSCCQARDVGENISGLRDECSSGGDAVDTVPSRECGEFAPLDADRKNVFAKSVDRDRCETRGSGISGERAQHKSWRDQMRGENGRLYARQCYSKEYSGIIPVSRERNDEERREKNAAAAAADDDDDDEEDEDGVAVINHKDSMCILAEKYKAGRKWRGRRCGDGARSDDRTGDKDECNKSLTSEIIDQHQGSSLEIANAVPHEGPSVKHVCRAAHCESCGTAAARTCGRGCGRHGPPEGEFDRLKSPLNETAATRCCSSRPSCRRVF
ncbi:PREDICTED: uncharacterized protein LOC105452945 [Wasmannia auropunctata]|uniref:uncharacterized protein LOC105452945 n=1 Tax=Wasmannia auropunctata TaxID=64793 RepID=UPI0005F04803|nr:PREDICTED: uncharacterized protein LOC105452945 [Wasmannia auropunctata]